MDALPFWVQDLCGVTQAYGIFLSISYFLITLNLEVDLSSLDGFSFFVNEAEDVIFCDVSTKLIVKVVEDDRYCVSIIFKVIDT